MVALRNDMTQQRFDQFLFTLKYPPNRFQLAILKKIAFDPEPIAVSALAGSGKTSLLKMIAALLQFMGEDPRNTVFQAFNVKIKDELNAELPNGFEAFTSHKLGKDMLTAYAKQNKLKLRQMSDYKYNQIANQITDRICDNPDETFKTKSRIKHLLEKVMATNTNPRDFEAVAQLATHYSIEATPAIIQSMPQAVDEAVRRFKELGEWDFIDMLYQPMALDLQPDRTYQYVLVDEAQDLNTLQQQISKKMLRPNGIPIFVGDENQAIYAFAGADANSFDNLKKEHNAKVYELNICYRCPVSHLRLAQSIVPQIEPADKAIEGVIEYKHLQRDLANTMKPGSMVISRLNAPLVGAFFDLILAEKPAIILGKDIGRTLITIMEKVSESKHFTFGTVLKHLDDYLQSETIRLEKRKNTESLISELADNIEALKLCITKLSCYDLTSFKTKLATLFVDAKDGYDKTKVVTLCSIHMAKGLEADQIGIIYQRPITKDKITTWHNTLPLVWKNQKAWEKRQELNLKYVAFTRAMKELVFFGGWANGEIPDVTDNGEDFELFDFMEEEPEESELMDTPDIEEPQVEPVLSDNGEIVVAEIIHDELEVETPVIESPSPIDLDALHQRLAWGQELLELTVECLTESQSAEGEVKQQKLSEALIYATDYSKWLNHQNFTLEQCALLVGEQHKFTLKNQHVSGIVETAVGEKKSQDKAIELALSMANNLLAIFPTTDGVSVESPVSESKSELPAPRFSGLADMIQPPVESVAWANWLLAHKDDVVILDTETTDLLDKKNPFKKIEIVSIAAIDLQGNTLLNTHIKPVHATINPDAAAVHGITMEVLEAEGATDFAANWDAIKACIEGKHVVIYNRDFDRAVLGGCVQLFELPMPEAKNWHCAMLRYVGHNSNKLSPWGKTGGWWKLSEALEQELLPVDANAHDALADVRMTRQLILKLATNDTNKWRNTVGFDTDEIVIVKASGAQMQVVKTQPSGELLLKGVDDPRVSLTVRASMVERINTEKVVSEPEPIAEEPIAEPVTVIETPVADEQSTDETTPRKRFVILGRIFDIDPVEYDTESEVAGYLREIEADDTATPLTGFLVQEWTSAPTFQQQNLVGSWAANDWLEHNAPIVEEKHIAAEPVVVADEPNVPDKVVDPYQPVKDKFRTYKLELLHELAELLQEIIDEKEAETETKPVTQ